VCWSVFIFFFQAEDGIRDVAVTGVQTCALPIWACRSPSGVWPWTNVLISALVHPNGRMSLARSARVLRTIPATAQAWRVGANGQIGRASCRGRGGRGVVGGVGERDEGAKTECGR